MNPENKNFLNSLLLFYFNTLDLSLPSPKTIMLRFLILFKVILTASIIVSKLCATPMFPAKIIFKPFGNKLFYCFIFINYFIESFLRNKDNKLFFLNLHPD